MLMSRFAKQLGLQVNMMKCEVLCMDSCTLDVFLAAAPSIHVTLPEHATLLGAPICISMKKILLKTKFFENFRGQGSISTCT